MHALCLPTRPGPACMAIIWFLVHLVLMDRTVCVLCRYDCSTWWCAASGLYCSNGCIWCVCFFWWNRGRRLRRTVEVEEETRPEEFWAHPAHVGCISLARAPKTEWWLVANSKNVAYHQVTVKNVRYFSPRKLPDLFFSITKETHTHECMFLAHI